MSEPTIGEMRKWIDEKLTYEFSNTIYMTIDHTDFEMLRAIYTLIEKVGEWEKTGVDDYGYGTTMTIRHWDALRDAWTDYGGTQSFGEFAREYLRPFRNFGKEKI